MNRPGDSGACAPSQRSLAPAHQRCADPGSERGTTQLNSSNHTRAQRLAGNNAKRWRVVRFESLQGASASERMSMAKIAIRVRKWRSVRPCESEVRGGWVAKCTKGGETRRGAEPSSLASPRGQLHGPTSAAVACGAAGRVGLRCECEYRPSEAGSIAWQGCEVGEDVASVPRSTDLGNSSITCQSGI